VSEDCQPCYAFSGKELLSDVNIVACEIVVYNEESSHASDNAFACSDSSHVETVVRAGSSTRLDDFKRC